MDSTSTLNAPATSDTAATQSTVIGVLFSRTILFAVVQALIAGALAVTGTPDAFARSAAWWPIVVTVVNVFSFLLLRELTRREGVPFKSVFFERGSVGKDLLILVGVLIIAAPAAMGPNLGLATLLFGHPEGALPMFVQRLPAWAAWLGFFGFPLTIAFAELPTYFGYVMPRLEKLWGSRFKALAASALLLAFQHATLPLIFDTRFFLWRLLMFVPFAFVVGTTILLRRSLLPYLLVVHALIDFGAAAMVLQAAK